MHFHVDQSQVDRVITKIDISTIHIAANTTLQYLTSNDWNLFDKFVKQRTTFPHRRISELWFLILIWFLCKFGGGGKHDKFAAFVKQWHISKAMMRINGSRAHHCGVTSKKDASVLTCIIPDRLSLKKRVNPENEWFRCFKLGWISMKGFKCTFSEKNNYDRCPAK